MIAFGCVADRALIMIGTPADARDFAIEAHGQQRYGDAPYDAHLAAVVQILSEFGYGGAYEAAGWLHDVVEDTGIVIDQVRDRFGDEVADLVDAVTGLGANRAERNARIYAGLQRCPAAAVVKLADRIANVEAAMPGSDHHRRYRREAPSFALIVEPNVPSTMWQRLLSALQTLDHGAG